ncbi:hypothetical protein CQ018_18125 [Arthrobacter sp. MYb227]|uniref:NADPH-dependent F420 reductase n=1 Tax=Arthrobacter sp. MYb227 TaxID=1848601 RepID=UPI000CFC70F0|nr:NAD(P)-binding domain-containing protein [Arthrobacter sp. MYb227]PQZ87379.1 hypothetical protein CQ018_18125 [Arthrobacter sp. MYb227]
MGIERIGILGAGRAGTALARVAAAEGLEVQIASSRTPNMMKYHLAQYATKARAVAAEDIAKDVAVVVLLVPQEELDDIVPQTLAGIILVDATNRWELEPLPDWFEEGLAAGLSSSAVIARRFPQCRVVKALNHISHWDLDAKKGSHRSAQRALGVASDDAPATEVVAQLVRTLGFDPVILTDLDAGRILEPAGPIFNEVLVASELRKLSTSHG